MEEVIQNINVKVEDRKECRKCKLFKNIDEYDKQKGAKDGRKPWCKLCCKDKNRKRYLDNRDKIISQVKDWQSKKNGFVPVQSPDNINVIINTKV